MRRAAALLLVAALAGAGFAVAESGHGREPTPGPPIVVLVFDALPESMLMQPGGGLDSARFPGFAQLARDATWYRNATTVHDSTIKSIPAILDGRRPRNDLEPTLADHPVNLFTLLHDRYRIAADEQGTTLCPTDVCGRQASELLGLLHGPRVAAFDAALDQVDADDGDDRPPLWYAHVLLPHEPLRYLPSGTTYEELADPEPGLDGNESFDNAFLTHQAEQRHLLQLGFADRLLRRFLGRLEASGVYDRALVVVTADHGMSFRVKARTAEPYRPGEIGWRRDLTPRNAQDVAFVPLFVKLPGQRSGRVDDSWVRTTDVLPTLLRAARVRRPPELIGRALGAPRPQPGRLWVRTNRRGHMWLDPAAMLRGRAATIARRARRFGVGAGAARLFRTGPHRELLGRRVRSVIGRLRPLDAGAASAPGLVGPGTDALRARYWNPERFVDVEPASGRVPCQVIGWLDGRAPWDRALALAVNGRIAAVGRSFEPMGSSGMNFALMAPPSAFRSGFNDVRLYEVRVSSR